MPVYMRVWVCERMHTCAYVVRACSCVCVCVQMSVYVCVCTCKYIYMYESEQGANKEREPAGGDSEEKTERESRLIRETRMSKGRNCQPGCETDNKLSSSGGWKADGGIGNLADDRQ
jgi:hypothetical protein